MTGTIVSAPSNGQRGKRPQIPIGTVHWRQHARVRGRIRSMRVQPWANVASLECVVVDDTGGLVIVFLGRRQVAGVELGRWLYADGVVGAHRGYLAMLNPEIELLVEGHPDESGAKIPKKRWWRKG
jgi:hypothetical protein